MSTGAHVFLKLQNYSLLNTGGADLVGGVFEQQKPFSLCEITFYEIRYQPTRWPAHPDGYRECTARLRFSRQ